MGQGLIQSCFFFVAGSIILALQFQEFVHQNLGLGHHQPFLVWFLLNLWFRPSRSTSGYHQKTAGCSFLCAQGHGTGRLSAVTATDIITTIFRRFFFFVVFANSNGIDGSRCWTGCRRQGLQQVFFFAAQSTSTSTAVIGTARFLARDFFLRRVSRRTAARPARDRAVAAAAMLATTTTTIIIMTWSCLVFYSRFLVFRVVYRYVRRCGDCFHGQHGAFGFGLVERFVC